MSEAKHDENSQPTLIGVSSDDGVTPVKLRVDPVTGYLLVKITSIADFATTHPRIKYDENSQPVPFAVTDDASQTPVPLMSDPNNPGQLLVQFT